MVTVSDEAATVATPAVVIVSVFELEFQTTLDVENPDGKPEVPTVGDETMPAPKEAKPIVIVPPIGILEESTKLTETTLAVAAVETEMVAATLEMEPVTAKVEARDALALDTDNVDA